MNRLYHMLSRIDLILGYGLMHFKKLVWPKTLVVSIFMCGLNTWSMAVESDDKRVFDQANQLFNQANEQSLVNPSMAQGLYQQSILKYQYLIEERDIETVELHTNLGNAYFLSGEQGWAVLHYQRALGIDPLHGDVLHSLDYVRGLTIDELPKSRGQIIKEAVTFWHRWPFAVRATCLGIAHVLLWGLVAVWLYRRSRWLYWVMASAAIVTLLFGGSLLTSHQRWDNPVDGVIVDREVIARQGDGVIYDNAFTSPLHAGTEFSLLKQRGGWYYVSLLNGDRCWLPADRVRLVRSE